MPALIINIVNNKWVVEVANTPISYNFLGTTIEEQTVNLRAFAEIMAEDDPDVRLCLSTEAWSLPEEEIAQQLFGTTDTIVYIGNVIYGSVGSDVLLDDLEIAGEALLAAL